MSEIERNRSLLWAPLLVALFLVVLFIGIEWFSIIPQAGRAAEGKLSAIETSQLGSFKELTQLFITWSLAVIGGAAYFLKATIEGKHKLTHAGLLASEGVILCSVVSIFFGHLALNALLNMLSMDLFNIRDRAIVVYGLLQYFSFLIAILAFFVFIHVTYFSSITERQKGETS